MNQNQDDNQRDIQTLNKDPDSINGTKTTNKGGMEVEEGEVASHVDGKVEKGSKKEDGDSSDDEKKAKSKKAKKEKKHKHSEKESKEGGSRKDKEDEVEKKKRKEGKSKKKDKKDRESPSRSKSPKKKHRSSRSFSRNTKSNRKKSESNSRSRSRSKSKHDLKRKKHSRSRSKDIRKKKDRSDSRSKRRSRSHDKKGSTRRYSREKEKGARRDSRSPRRNERTRERSPVRRSRERRDDRRDDRRDRRYGDEGRRHERDREEHKKEKVEEKIEEEPVDEEFSKKMEMALLGGEDNEERIARERREQRRALLEKFGKKEEEESSRHPERMETEPLVQNGDANQHLQTEQTVEKEKREKIQEEVVSQPKTEEKKKVEKAKPNEKVQADLRKEESKMEEEGLDKIRQEQNGDENGDDNDQEPVRKWSTNHNHSVEKEKYIKLIESMRNKLQKEEEDLREENEEEEKKKEKEEESEAKEAKNQDFDMFAETPESLEAEKVSKPTVGVDNQSWDDENGYYRGQIGEIMNDKYKIIAKLGKGVFGNVFKGQDVQTNENVAIKIVKSEDIYMMSGYKEREILSMLNDADKHHKRHVIRLHDSFEYRKHLVLIFELMEMDLRQAIKTFGKKVGLSIESVRSYARQLFIALAHLKKHKIIHADLKPDNILVTNNQKTLKLSDFGSAFPVEENTITPYLVARYYRAPEIMLGCPYDTAVDMWSAACTIFELYTGKILFPGKDNNDMLKLIIQSKGRFNNKMLKKGEFSSQYFDHQNNFLSTEIDPVTKEKYVKPIPIGNKITRDVGNMLNAVEIELSQEDRKKVAQLKDLLERCLTLDPNKRLSAEEALKSQFINYGIQKLALDTNTIKHAF